MKKIGYFEEKEGVKSSTRLTSFLLFFFFCAFNILYVVGAMQAVKVIADLEGVFTMNFIIFDFVLLIGIFAPKYLHKLAESKLISK